MSGAEFAIAAAVAAATVADGYAQYQQGKAEKKAYDANAEILKNNAVKKRLETSLNEDTARSENRRKLAKLEAAMAENGQSSSPTAIGVIGQEASDMEQNVLNMRYAGMSEAENFENQSNLQSYYGKQAKDNGKNAFKMSWLTGGVKGYGAYKQYK